MWVEGMLDGRGDCDWASLKDCCSYSSSVKPGPGHRGTKPRGSTHAAATMGRKPPAPAWHPLGWWQVQLQEQEKQLGALCPWKETITQSQSVLGVVLTVQTGYHRVLCAHVPCWGRHAQPPWCTQVEALFPLLFLHIQTDVHTILCSCGAFFACYQEETCCRRHAPSQIPSFSSKYTPGVL